jgi:hypothetical protein
VQYQDNHAGEDTNDVLVGDDQGHGQHDIGRLSGRVVPCQIRCSLLTDATMCCYFTAGAADRVPLSARPMPYPGQHTKASLTA